MKRRTPAEAEEALRNAGMEPIDSYPGSIHKPWRSRCLTCGTERSPRLTNIVHGGKRGCVCRPEKFTPHPGGLEGVAFHAHPGYTVFLDGSIRGPSGWVTPFPDRDGYLRFNVHKLSQRSVHVAVCVAFHGPRPSESHEAAHLDGNKLNNEASNLAWCTSSENEGHKVAHGTVVLGESHHAAKLKASDVKRIRTLHAEGAATDEIALLYPTVTLAAIQRVAYRRSWRHVE